jgi:hypothetical protein
LFCWDANTPGKCATDGKTCPRKLLLHKAENVMRFTVASWGESAIV